MTCSKKEAKADSQSVKAVLSDNKIFLSASFAALLQTLKSDPQMVNLIQNIAAANNGEQHKDNYIDITQYFESNKDSILYLIEKHYENLVEALTNNAIGSAANSSYPTSTLSSSFCSDPALSLPQASSRFPNLFNQSDRHRIEEPNTHHNSKDGFAE